MTNQARLSIGANNPPPEEQLMIEKLSNDHSDILMVYEANINKEPEIPTVINDDDAAAKVGDYIKKLTACNKMLDSTRTAEKEPHLAKGRIVDNFFKGRMEKLTDVKKRVEAPLADYLKRKEDEKRRLAEEKAAEAKAEADRKLREMQEREAELKAAKERAEKEAAEAAQRAEAARKAQEAEAARLRAEAEAAAQKLRDDAAAAAAAAQAEIDRLKAAAAQADEEKRKEAERVAKAAEKAKEEADRAIKAAEREAKAKIDEAERAIRFSERETKADIRASEESLNLLNKEVKEAARETNRAIDDAVRHDKIALKADRAAEEKGSILSRTRGDASMSSVTETWVGHVQDRDELFHEVSKIWDMIPFDALEQAVNAYVRAGGRQLRGAIIEQETKVAVR